MIKFISFTLLATLLVGCSSNQGYESPEELAQACILAINQKDAEGLRRLIHPECKKGLSKLEQEYLDLTIETHLKSVSEIPGDAAISIHDLKGWSPPSGDNSWRWPVIPTHQFSIDFDTGEYSSVGVADYIVQDNGRWFLVWAFPSETELRRMSK